MRRRCFRRWYGRLRKAFPGKLPPPSRVRVSFQKMKDYAAVEIHLRNKKVVQAHIQINRKVKNDPGSYILAEFAHEIVHMLHPRMKHGARFEHRVVDIKVICEPRNDTWY